MQILLGYFRGCCNNVSTLHYSARVALLSFVFTFSNWLELFCWFTFKYFVVDGRPHVNYN